MNDYFRELQGIEFYRFLLGKDERLQGLGIMADMSRRNVAIGSTSTPEFEGYEVVKRLGYGAASVIFSVRDKATGKIRAMKHVARESDKDKRVIEQVENEFRVANRVDHPYVRKVYEMRRRRRHFKTVEVFLLMEYCPGISLEQSPGRSLLDVLLIFRMVANGLNGMHNVGMVHCDIKPNNIIIADNGAISIIDLGQSCSMGTVKRRIQGTPDYIAPEQVKRKPMTRQTDMFNLGATMYWALTGRHIPTLIPRGSDRVDLAVESAGPPPSPHELKSKIPVGLSNLIMECVRELPNNRPPDMPTLISRLDMLIHIVAGGKLVPFPVRQFRVFPEV